MSFVKMRPRTASSKLLHEMTLKWRIKRDETLFLPPVGGVIALTKLNSLCTFNGPTPKSRVLLGFYPKVVGFHVSPIF